MLKILRLAELGADLLKPKVGTPGNSTNPQESQATYAPLIQKQDYSLDWSKPAIALHNQVRGFFPNCAATSRRVAENHRYGSLGAY